MVQTFLAFRYIMLAASLGAAAGAMLMFWQGGMDLIGAAQSISGSEASKGVAAYVMAATDAILFGIVLIIFAYAIAFGLVLEPSPKEQECMPPWMRVDSVSHLKHLLIEVILVYLIVDVATDWANSESLDQLSLIKPASIILIAGALRLLSRPGTTQA